MSTLPERKPQGDDSEAYKSSFCKEVLPYKCFSLNLLELRCTHDDLQEYKRNWPPDLPHSKGLRNPVSRKPGAFHTIFSIPSINSLSTLIKQDSSLRSSSNTSTTVSLTLKPTTSPSSGPSVWNE
jgi:hypothetical protein